MSIIYKKKIYNGMAELRDYERDKFIKRGKPLKIVIDNEYMILSIAKLKNGKVTNTQHSMFNKGQTYKLIGYRWHPQGRIEEQTTIDFDVRKRLAEVWKKTQDGFGSREA